MGIGAPKISGSTEPKSLAVSTTSGKMSAGKWNIPRAQLAQDIVNGSNMPVALAFDTSLTCNCKKNIFLY